MSLAGAVLALTLGRPATLGAGHLVCIDGPAGSGKTTLAAAVAAASAAPYGTRVVHLDDLYDGWRGLARVGEQLDRLLVPLASGTHGTYRRYDWRAGAFAETVSVPPAPLVVLEGVGSGARAHSHLATVLMWVTAPAGERDRRGLARDGEGVAPHWGQWAHDEADHFAREHTAARADVWVDGTGRLPPLLRRPAEPTA